MDYRNIVIWCQTHQTIIDIGIVDSDSSFIVQNMIGHKRGCDIWIRDKKNVNKTLIEQFDRKHPI